MASYDKALLVTGGKLKSTDGTYGLRFAHNTDVMVTGLTMTKRLCAGIRRPARKASFSKRWLLASLRG